MTRMGTIGDRMRVIGGYSSGFDYLRLVLALMVLFTHSFQITADTEGASALPYWIVGTASYFVLPMFFALSGFLVAASLVRTQSLLVFLSLRGLRILPALMVEVTLSALVLGPMLTTVSFRDYVSSYEFFQYFLNVVGDIHYNLPGVFADNPIPRTVNLSLWTVPYEAECYFLLAAISIVGLVKRPKLLLSGFLLISLIFVVRGFLHGSGDPGRGIVSGRQLVLFFVGGVTVYLWRDKIPYSPWMAAVAAAVSLILCMSFELTYLASIPIAYATAVLGLQVPRKLPVIFSGDYSYGIYLYAFPMQQTVWHLWPSAQSWYFNLAVTLILVSLFAAFSWHCIEKPVLRLKRFILARSRIRPVSDAPDGGADGRSGAASMPGVPAAGSSPKP